MTDNFTVTIIANKINKSQGGSNFSLDLIARTLVERGHDVNVVTLNLSSGNKPFPDRKYDVFERSVSKHSLLTFRPIVNVFNEWEAQTDVYHVFSPLIAPYAGKYRRDGGETPVLCRLNQYSMFCSNVAKMDGNCHQDCAAFDRLRHSSDKVSMQLIKTPLFILQSDIFPRLANRVDKYYAVSPRVREIYSEFGIDESRIESIPNFYNPELSPKNFERSPDSGELDILYVGRLSDEKGVSYLINSTQYLDDPVSLHIVGDGPKRSQLETLATEVETSSRIIFHGFVENDELHKYYTMADVFVLPASWPEPFSRTLLEAMQFGCALIVTDTGGSAWAVDEAGIVVPRNNSTELSRSINNLSQDRNYLKQLSCRSEERAQTFSPDSVISQIISLKKDIIRYNNQQR